MGCISHFLMVPSLKNMIFQRGFKIIRDKKTIVQKHKHPSSRCLGIAFRVPTLQLESLTQLQEEPETRETSTDQKQHGHPLPTLKTQWTLSLLEAEIHSDPQWLHALLQPWHTRGSNSKRGFKDLRRDMKLMKSFDGGPTEKNTTSAGLHAQ